MSITRPLKNLTVVNGDLFKMTLNGDFDVIAQGCNCFNVQGAGIAVMFNRLFNTLSFPMEQTGKGDINKLGTIDAQDCYFQDQYNRWVWNSEGQHFSHKVTVVNAYTQYSTTKTYGAVAADYDAIRLAMRKINHQYKGLRVGLPFIGAGLAGGDAITIQAIMDEELTDVKPTLVIYE